MNKILLSTLAASALATTSSMAAVVIDTGSGTTNATSATYNTYLAASAFDGNGAATQSVVANTTVTGFSTVPSFKIYTSLTLSNISVDNLATFTDVQSAVQERNNTTGVLFDQFGYRHQVTATPLGISSFNAVVIEKAHWTGAAGFDGSFSSLSSVSMVSSLAQRVSGSNIGFVVQNGSDFYVSDTSFATATVPKSITDLASQNWFLFDPTVVGFGITSVQTPGGTGVAGNTFTDIQSIGWIAQHTVAANTASVNSFSALVGDFNADLVLTPTAVPEPSTFAALAGLGALGFAATRRRRA